MISELYSDDDIMISFALAELSVIFFFKTTFKDFSFI